MRRVFIVIITLGILALQAFGESLPKEQPAISTRTEPSTNFVIRIYKNGEDIVNFGVLGKNANCQIRNTMLIPYAKGYQSNRRIYLFKDPDKRLIYLFKDKLMSIYTEKDEEMEIMKNAYRLEYLSPSKNIVTYDFMIQLDEGYWEH